MAEKKCKPFTRVELKPLRLATLEEMEEMEKMAGGQLKDTYNSAYIKFLRQGMPPKLAHFEAIAVKHEGEENLCDNLKEQLLLERERYQRTLSSLSSK